MFRANDDLDVCFKVALILV